MISLCIDNDKVFEKYKTMWTKIAEFKKIQLDALPVYNDRHTKTKIRTHGEKFYTNFRGLNVPEDCVEWEYFTVISIDSLLFHENKYYLQVYLDNCAYKIAEKKMIDCLEDNLFETN